MGWRGEGAAQRKVAIVPSQVLTSNYSDQLVEEDWWHHRAGGERGGRGGRRKRGNSFLFRVDLPLPPPCSQTKVSRQLKTQQHRFFSTSYDYIAQKVCGFSSHDYESVRSLHETAFFLTNDFICLLCARSCNILVRPEVHGESTFAACSPVKRQISRFSWCTQGAAIMRIVASFCTMILVGTPIQ